MRYLLLSFAMLIANSALACPAEDDKAACKQFDERTKSLPDLARKYYKPRTETKESKYVHPAFPDRVADEMHEAFCDCSPDAKKKRAEREAKQIKEDNAADSKEWLAKKHKARKIELDKQMKEAAQKKGGCLTSCEERTDEQARKEWAKVVKEQRVKAFMKRWEDYKKREATARAKMSKIWKKKAERVAKTMRRNREIKAQDRTERRYSPPPPSPSLDGDIIP